MRFVLATLIVALVVGCAPGLGIRSVTEDFQGGGVIDVPRLPPLVPPPLPPAPPVEPPVPPVPPVEPPVPPLPPVEPPVPPVPPVEPPVDCRVIELPSTSAVAWIEKCPGQPAVLTRRARGGT
jgi:hypothetical protein